MLNPRTMADVDYLCLDEDEAFYEAEPLKSVFNDTELQIVILIFIIWISLFIMTCIYMITIAKMTEVVENVPSGRQLAALVIFPVGMIFSFILVDYVCFIHDVNEEPPYRIINLGDEGNLGAYD